MSLLNEHGLLDSKQEEKDILPALKDILVLTETFSELYIHGAVM